MATLEDAGEEKLNSPPGGTLVGPVGPGVGLAAQRLMETALNEEMTEHLVQRSTT